MAAELWTHMGFARAAGILGASAGLRFAANRQPAAEQAMRRVMESRGIRSPLRFANELGHDEELLAQLLAEITIGETYFFREQGQVDYIRQYVLPEFRACRSPEHPLRVWSAGCATGEECYTLAIVLRESGWTGKAELLGTDISLPRLQAARQARYTRWSMRGVAPEALERYFIRRGTQYLLRPELRAMAEFRTLNLAGPGWPGGESGIAAMDIILCRNVLIYFDRKTVSTVAARLIASLSDDGWLFMGASDPLLSELVDCETVVTGAGIAYRRASTRTTRLTRVVSGVPARMSPPPTHEQPLVEAAPAPGLPGTDLLFPTPPEASPGDPPPPAAAPAVHGGGEAVASMDPSSDREEAPGLAAESRLLLAAEARYAERDYAAARDTATGLVARAPQLARGWVLLVRSLANGGQVADAERACARAIELHPASAELAYLHSVLLIEGGQFAAAAAAARRALYLDRTLVVAHLALGAALARLGHPTQARRSFGSAERQLERMAAGLPVPFADGETAHRLRQAAQTQRRLLDGVVA